jgi:3-isopropylmalate/(R)-2-methylmalate dehydratase large subunit
MVVIGADSHTCTYGALGAFSTGVGSTDVAGFLLTGKAWFKVPPTVKAVFTGTMGKWLSGKDLILLLIGKIGVSGAQYKALEFSGPAIDGLSVEGRLTMANMAIEAGGKNGVFPADGKVIEFLKNRTKEKYEVMLPDADAVYEHTVEIDVTGLDPVVACPHLPENVKPARDLADTRLDQVVIGSCTNGRIEDLRVAAGILKGRRVNEKLRCLVIPATPGIYRQALDEGLFQIFLDAHAVISPPTCGPCLGGHMGILAEGERCVATTNRNFVGRMGHMKSEIYLASPAVAAASAVTGRITDPAELMR